MKDSENRYQRVIESSHDIIWEFDVNNGLISYTSTRSNYWKSIHFKRKIQFESSKARIHSEERDLMEKSFKKTLLDRKCETWRYTYRIKGVDGNYRWISDHASILRDKNGTAIKCLVAAKDITQIRSYLESIELQNERFREIGWTQSHLLCPHVVNIQGLLRLIKIEMRSDGDYEDLMVYLEQCVEELDEVVKSIVIKSDSVIKKDIENTKAYESVAKNKLSA